MDAGPLWALLLADAAGQEGATSHRWPSQWRVPGISPAGCDAPASRSVQPGSRLITQCDNSPVGRGVDWWGSYAECRRYGHGCFIWGARSS